MPSDRELAARPTRPARATVWIDGAPVTILPRRAPVGNSGPIRGHTLAIFPIPATGEAFLTVALPGQATERFTAMLDPGSQPALAVADLTEADALAVGRVLGLDELLFWDGRRAQVVTRR